MVPALPRRVQDPEQPLVLRPVNREAVDEDPEQPPKGAKLLAPANVAVTAWALVLLVLWLRLPVEVVWGAVVVAPTSSSALVALTALTARTARAGLRDKDNVKIAE